MNYNKWFYITMNYNLSYLLFNHEVQQLMGIFITKLALSLGTITRITGIITGFMIGIMMATHGLL